MSLLPREAVLIVHGQGEQAPFETLRSFVGRSTPRARSTTPNLPAVGITDVQDNVFSEPISTRGRVDDRALIVAWNHEEEAAAMRGRDGEPPTTYERQVLTDFYELYWAPRFGDTSMSQVAAWAGRLMRRRRSSFRSPRLLGPKVASRFLAPFLVIIAVAAPVWWSLTDTPPKPWIAALAVAAGIGAVLSGLAHGVIGSLRALSGVALAWTIGAVLLFGLSGVQSLVGTLAGSAVVVAVLGWIGRKVSLTLGDSARYLSTSPREAEEIDRIRAQARDLILDLHQLLDPDTGRPRYQRLVIVAHSLGSVIAYDAIRAAWSRVYRNIELPEPGSESDEADAVRRVETAGRALDGLAARSIGTTRADPDAEPADAALAEARTEFHRAQRELHCYLRDKPVGQRWIVSDFVTLGSPLSHADAFMATSPADLDNRFDGRELAACPPMPQQTRESGEYPYRMKIVSKTGATSTRLHHAAQFGSVVWTNAWFEHDVVGGPLALHFGAGVRDLDLGGSRWLAWFALAYPHSSYWAVSQRRLLAEGSQRIRNELRALIRRPPTMIIDVSAEPDASQRRELINELDRQRLDDPALRVDVRLNVRTEMPEQSPERTFLPFPNSSWSSPTRSGILRLRDISPASGVAVYLGADLLSRQDSR